MPDYLEIEAENLLEIAEQHRLAAVGLREWGQIPYAWLEGFQDGYGTIADQVRSALWDYYHRRHDKAEHLAAQHDRTHDALIASARRLEAQDLAGGQDLGHSGNFDQPPPTTHSVPDIPTAPTAPITPGPDAVDAPPAEPPLPGVSGALDAMDHSARLDQPSQPFGSTIPGGYTAPEGYGDQYAAVGATTGLASSGGAPFGTDSLGTTSPRTDTPSHDFGTIPAAAAATSAGLFGAERRAVLAGVPVTSFVGPFAAAAHVAERTGAPPPFVVGAEVGDDLVLARTLLAAILAATTDSASDVEWAVAVVRISAGRIVMLSSTEGRGWLPSGLFLPAEIVLPWRWDVLFDALARDALTVLEGTTDPARILVEFCALARQGNIPITALASSAPIPDGVRASLGDDVAFEGSVLPAVSPVDLTAPGVGLLDRLALAGSQELLQQEAVVPDTEIRATCLALAQAADAGVRAAGSGDPELSAHHVRRQRILDALQDGRAVPVSWWDEIRVSGGAAAMRARRVDVSPTPVGGVGSDLPETDVVRRSTFERRADELLLLLVAGEPDRQTLRDAFYTYGQITEHPLFPAAARAAAARVAQVTGRPVVAAVEPSRSAGPGSGSGLVSVGPIGSGGQPPYTPLSASPAESAGSGEQRRVQ